MTAILAFFDTKLGKYLLMAAVAIAAAVAFGSHERSVGFEEAMDKVEAQRRAEAEAWLKVMALRMTAYRALEEKQNALTAQHDIELQAKDAQRLAELDALKKRIPRYVTPAATRSCPDVPRSYLMFRADAAAFANRATNSIPAAASTDAPETASGVSLADLAGTDADQAGAYRACAERDDFWLKYKAEVEAWAAEVNRIIKGGS